MKEFADDNFRFDENSRKLSKRVENTVGKGEIAHYEQFLLFPQCFQKACFPGASKGVIVWEWVKLTPVLLKGAVGVCGIFVTVLVCLCYYQLQECSNKMIYGYIYFSIVL